MTIKEIITYFLTLAAFIVTATGIAREKKIVAICGALAMAILTGYTFYT